MTTRTISSFAAVVMMLCSAAAVRAEVPEPPDPTAEQVEAGEQQSQWVQRLQDASSLLTAGKPAEALKAFESLQAQMPEQDTDGVLALAIGDCQFTLGQYEQARQTYLRRRAASGHGTEPVGAAGRGKPALTTPTKQRQSCSGS